MIRLKHQARRRPATAMFAGAALLLGAGLAEASSSSARVSGKAANSAAKSPRQLVGDAQSALRASHGYLMAGEMTQGQQKLGLRLTYAGAKLEMAVRQGTATAAIISLPGSAYIKANRAYWKSQGGGAVMSYANHWIQLPASYSRSFTRELGQFNPKTLARCLGEDHGKLTRAGTGTVSGKRVVVIHDAGGVPGSSPGNLDIAASGPAYPLRLTTTGRTLKGGKVDVCNDGKGDNSRGSLTLSRFNNPPSVKTPAHPINLTTTTTTTG